MGVQPTLVTNGWLLPGKLDAHGRRPASPRVFISIDSADAAAHEKNRGLRGVCERIRGANERAAERGIMPIASVAMSRLVTDYTGARPLPAGAGLRRRHLLLSAQGAARLVLARLVGGQRSGGPLARPSCWPPSTRWTRCADIIPVHNPRASIADIRRRLRGEAERFHCLAGYKYFYLDWNYDLWRCEDWKRAALPGLGVRARQDGARRLPGLHHRLLPRRERDAALRGGARRRLRPAVGGPPGRRRGSARRSAATPLRWARSSPTAAASGGSRAWADRSPGRSCLERLAPPARIRRRAARSRGGG